MNSNYFVYLVLLVSLLLLSGCKKDAENVKIPDSVKFMVISDIHYFDPALFTLPANAGFQGYLATDRKLIMESSAILKSVLASVQIEKPDFLLVTGDLTKDGEKLDHQTLATLFKGLSDNGIKVLVIPGNHDINNGASNSYLQSGVAKVANISATEFASIYDNNGYGTAIERDPSSLSYVSEPVDGLWVLGIDACHYLPSSETAGSISTTTLAWIKSIISKAKAQNKVLISMMHHGLVEHFPGQGILFPEYLISDWQNVSTSLSDIGLKVIFTGHFHAQDIVKKTSTSGFLFDIETGSTVSAPCPYRLVSYNRINNTMKIESRNITDVSFSTIPSGNTFAQYSKSYLASGMKDLSFYILSSPPYSIPAATIAAIALDRILATALFAHYAGDETASTADITDIQTVKSTIPLLGGALEGIWTDLPSADNNVTINLSTGTATNN